MLHGKWVLLHELFVPNRMGYVLYMHLLVQVFVGPMHKTGSL
jgi:hypothetical protein